jgi:hypothetical protein
MADVVINIDVDDANARARLTALEQRLRRLDAIGGRTGKSFDGLGGDIDGATNSANKLNDTLGETNNKLGDSNKKSRIAAMSLRTVGSSAKVLGTVFGRLAKFAMFAGIEFGVMAIVLGTLKLALVAGELTSKAFSASLTGLAAVAGLAVGALGGVLAAIRELNNAKMVPLARMAKEPLTGSSNMASNVSAIMGDRNLGIFKDATLTGSIGATYKAGFQADATLKSMMGTLGNFAVVASDPDKALSSLTQAFMSARKEGKFTDDTIKTIAEDAPQLADAIKASGMGFEDFFGALRRGEIDSLAPFNDALDRVNDTLIGRFKGSLRVIKEQLTTLGAPLVDLVKGPLAGFERELGFFITSIQPAVRKAFEELFPDTEGRSGGAMGKFFEYLSLQINQALPKIDNFLKGFKGFWGGFRSVFGNLGDWLRRMTSGWNTLFENILKPLGVEVWKTIEHAISGFNDRINDTAGSSKNFGDQIKGIFEGLRGIITGFNNFAKALAPVTSALLQILSIIGKIASNPLISTLLVSGFLGNRLFRKLPGGGPGGVGVSGPGGFLASAGGAGGSILGRKALADAQAGKNTMLGAYGSARLAGGSRAQAAKEAITFGKSAGRGIAEYAKGAAVGGAMVAGTVVGGLISSKARKTDATMQGIGQALSMGGMGAGMGMMIGGPAGAAIGGGLGLAAGAVMGVMGARKAQEEEEKTARERARQEAFGGLNTLNQTTVRTRIDKMTARQNEVLDAQVAKDRRGQIHSQLRTSLSASARQGDYTTSGYNAFTDIYGFASSSRFDEGDAFKRAADMQKFLAENTNTVTEEQKKLINSMIEADKAYDTVKKGLDDMTDAQLKAFADEMEISVDDLELASRTFVRSNNDLFSALGMTEEQAQKVADKFGKNLVTDLITLDEAVTNLGFSLNEQGKVMDDAASRAVAAQRTMRRVLEPLNNALEALEKQSRYEAAGESFFNLFGAGSKEVTTSGTEYLGAFMDTKFQERINAANDPNNTETFQQYVQRITDLLKGQLDAARTQGADPAVIAFLDAQVNGVNGVVDRLKLAISDLALRLQEDPAMVASLQGMVNTAVSALNTEAFRKLSEADQQNVINQRVGQIEQMLSSSGIEITPDSSAQIKAMILAGMQDSGAFQTLAIVNGFNQGTAQMIERLNGVTLKVESQGGGDTDDTRSPRRSRTGDTTSSRWRGTLGKHMAVSSLVPGNRTITSGVRDFNLGSPSSDHLTGNAYDLTGDNLGQYAGAINDSGGFAEVHGSAGSRHLHVVPPMGDSTTPAMVGGMSSAGGSMTNNYTINVNGGSDPADIIARKVIDEIDRRERTSRERS